MLNLRVQLCIYYGLFDTKIYFLTDVLVQSRCLKWEDKEGCPLDNQVAIFGCQVKFLVVRKLPQSEQLILTNKREVVNI